MKQACILLLSGGQDSTTCLYWAKTQFEKIYPILFDYGQKHRLEIRYALKNASDAGTESPYIIPCSGVFPANSSSLIDHSIDHKKQHLRNTELPASFTPGRNMLFLTMAASYGFSIGVHDIVTGVCQTDYSGYPDCRQSFISSMETTLEYAMNPEYTYDKPFHDPMFQIHTPLMHMTKAQTWKMAKDLRCLDIIIQYTMTDYNGDQTTNEWGMGTVDNPASALRAKGYYEAKEKGWI
jgi:7-cyano-7-deazaguanine synthase